MSQVLALDTDMLVISDPYPLLFSPPISHYHMVLAPEGGRVNLGFLYVRGAAMQPGGGASSESESERRGKRPGFLARDRRAVATAAWVVLAPGTLRRSTWTAVGARRASGTSRRTTVVSGGRPSSPASGPDDSDGDSGATPSWAARAWDWRFEARNCFFMAMTVAALRASLAFCARSSTA